jgi:putative CocE/NonD family hydrolase
MPDGGRIALTILREANITAKQPAVLVYNIYAGNDVSKSEAAAERGYVSIVANPRGIRIGKEAVEPFEHEANDIYYIIDWISKQTWCNGKVGMYGASYLGFSQWAASKKLHPALKTIVPMVPVAPGIDFPIQNGIVANFTLRWLHFVTDSNMPDYKGFSDQEKWNNLMGEWYKKGSSYRSLDSLEGHPFPLFQKWLQHPTNDAFWRQMIPQQNDFAKINIPVLTFAGYYDYDQIGTLHYFKELQKWNKSNESYLVIGPYDHGGAQGSISKNLKGYEIDSVANIPILDIVFEWLDYVLKDGEKPSFLKDKINFEVMGSNEWQHVPTLNQMHNDSIRFYLGNVKKGNHFDLLAKQPKKSSFIDQTVDLKDRSEMNFSTSVLPDITIIEDSILHTQKEQLVFISDPIDKEFAISGAVTASFVASLNKKDVDVMFAIYELSPDGKFMALTSNVQRASYAKDDGKRNLLTPNKKQTIVIDNTYMTSRQLQKGSRIVLVMGVNKNPNWQINYGTGKDVNDESILDADIPFQIKWYNDSYITVPILR